jgi:hypothetical protein
MTVQQADQLIKLGKQIYAILLIILFVNILNLAVILKIVISNG